MYKARMAQFFLLLHSAVCRNSVNIRTWQEYMNFQKKNRITERRLDRIAEIRVIVSQLCPGRRTAVRILIIDVRCQNLVTIPLLWLIHTNKDKPVDQRNEGCGQAALHKIHRMRKGLSKEGTRDVQYQIHDRGLLELWSFFGWETPSTQYSTLEK